jgi:colanic acid/amylovoran biosynthesis glycosyltransferase
MNIAFIIEEFPALSETFILNQITGLLDLGHRVDIFAKTNPGEEKVHQDVKKYDLMDKTHYLLQVPQNMIIRFLKALLLIIKNLHRNPCLIIKALNFLKRGKDSLFLRNLYYVIPFLDNDYDIIQCHFGPNGNIGARLKQIGLKGKLVTMFHGYDIRLGLEKGKDFYSQLFEFGNTFLSISDYNHRNLICLGADPKKIVFHPVGIDTDKYPFKWNQAKTEDSKDITIITVARLCEDKGLQYGIRAIKKLQDQKPELHLKYNIIGAGPLENRLNSLVRELNLNTVVHFLGPMEEEGVRRNMQSAHIYLLPSVAEALPVVLMEALSTGLPVVATTVGSISQLIMNGKTGFLVPPRDIDALSDRLIYLIEHPELWPQMGQRGSEFIKKNYDIKILNKRLTQIYSQLLSTT